MGRPYFRLVIESEERLEIERRFRRTQDARQRERLEVLRLAYIGQQSLARIAAQMGRSRATVQTWLDTYQSRGLEGLLERGKPGRRESPLQDPHVQDDFQAQLTAGNFSTAAHAARWLREHHGIERTVWSMYYWLKKCGTHLRVPRPVQIKNAGVSFEAFRNADGKLTTRAETSLEEFDRKE
jgi:transposase